MKKTISVYSIKCNENKIYFNTRKKAIEFSNKLTKLDIKFELISEKKTIDLNEDII